MEREMRVRPGTPDDDNREYLPEKIKNSDIVVNENGNNSQPYPERLKEYREVLADGVEDICMNMCRKVMILQKKHHWSFPCMED